MESLAPDLREMRRRPLQDDHVAALKQAGSERRFGAGELVAKAGDPMDAFLYLLEGEVEVVNPATGERSVPETLGPGQYVGEIAFLNGGVYTVPLRAVRKTTVLSVPRTTMLDLMARIPEMSDIVITVFAARRRRLLDERESSLILVGAEASRDLSRCESFLSRNRIPYRALELGTPEARALAERCGAPDDHPFAAFGDGGCVENPTPAALARVLGLDLAVDADEVMDVLIVGAGPAGVAAAVYAGAEGLRALVVESLAIGGQAGTSSRIENYMGFPTGISGGDLVWRGEIQAMKFGTRFAMPRRVTSLEKRGDGLFCATLDDGLGICAKAVVVATGVQYRQLPIERLADFEGAGVYYAATETEARFCREAEVIVVGGGNSAGQAAMFLSRKAGRVHLLVRGASLATSMSEYLSSRLEAEPSVDIRYRTEIDALHGDDRLNGATLRRNDTGETSRIDCPGVFVMVGAAPNTGWLSGLVELDAKGFVRTGREVGGRTAFETSHPGVFAVGDVRAGSVKRVASGVGEGSVVISAVWDHVNAQS